MADMADGTAGLTEKNHALFYLGGALMELGRVEPNYFIAIQNLTSAIEHARRAQADQDAPDPDELSKG